ncbi:hypothetical protein [Bradyrhizobium sp. WSM1417]|uniref:hypothetical protein n=1 Tax=Bradyrhizobium sp. WSM1417 TaxID=754500 RepID=UPI0012ECACC3|nr:hypothetical protein [Bradyrhizobium sp. WSM1417]
MNVTSQRGWGLKANSDSALGFAIRNSVGGRPRGTLQCFHDCGFDVDILNLGWRQGRGSSCSPSAAPQNAACSVARLAVAVPEFLNFGRCDVSAMDVKSLHDMRQTLFALRSGGSANEVLERALTRGGIAHRKAMMDREHDLPITRHGGLKIGQRHRSGIGPAIGAGCRSRDQPAAQPGAWGFRFAAC